MPNTTAKTIATNTAAAIQPQAELPVRALGSYAVSTLERVFRVAVVIIRHDGPPSIVKLRVNQVAERAVPLRLSRYRHDTELSWNFRGAASLPEPSLQGFCEQLPGSEAGRNRPLQCCAENR